MTDYEEFDEGHENKLLKALAQQQSLNKTQLYNADPNCTHNVVAKWSGVECTKCPGWFCY
jgi:hypothetical protein